VEYYATQLDISGWVRNVGWDTVETVAEGPREQIDRFIEMVKTGPRASRVDDARVEEEVMEGMLGFTVRSSR
jgi:acylphosphatase